MNQRALAGNEQALGAVQLCEMVYTPKQMDSLDSRSGAPNHEIELFPARSVGASDAHLVCQPRFKRFCCRLARVVS